VSWPRALLSGAAVVFMAFAALVYVPNTLVSSLSGVGRGTRVALATVWFSVAVVGLLWALRVLQSRLLRK
jgi:hypothetical protein